MTLEEAIETLTTYTEGTNPWALPDLVKAAKLGIEAGKRIQKGRERIELVSSGLLPGETQ